jgi:hypothetical protein
MTPAAILAGIPVDLIRRHDNPDEQLKAAKQLAQWFNARGHRPTWAEIEAERSRRASRAA